MNGEENERIELNDSNTNTGQTITTKELTINAFFYIGIIIKILFWFIFYFYLPSSSSRDSFFNDEEFDLGRTIPFIGLIMVLISTILIWISNMDDALPYPDIFLSIFLLSLLFKFLNKRSFYVFLMVFIYLILSSSYFVMNSTIILNGSNDYLKFLYLVETVPVIFVLIYTISKTF